MLNCPLYTSFPPEYEPNEAQEHIISEIERALELGKKYIIISAPTGTGKSFIAKTLANHSDDPSTSFIEACKSYQIYDSNSAIENNYPFGAAVLTITKSLQDQYIEMFPDGAVLKGKSNYQCALDNNHTCDDAICLVERNQVKKCTKNDTCPYFNKRNEAAMNICSFYSYAMFESLPETIKNKEFIICDEASELETELVSRYTVEISLKDIEKLGDEFPITPNFNSSKITIFEWISTMSSMLESKFNSYSNEITKKLKENKRKKKINKEEFTYLSLLRRYRDAFALLIDTWGDTDYILSHTTGGVIFQPYNVDKLAQRIFKYGKIIILMSATIVNPKRFAKNLGINDYYYIEAANTFSSKRAPIKATTMFKLNYKNKAQILPKMVNVAKEICKVYPNKKGIIHTHSMEVLKYLESDLYKDSRFLFRNKENNNERILEIHQNTNAPTVLVSPSMTHGVDLKGELGEFQIVMKAPFLPLNDERIKRKVKDDPDWYAENMLSTLIQMCGRCNRSENDFSVTYILDGTIVDVITRYKDTLPKYFLERFV